MSARVVTEAEASDRRGAFRISQAAQSRRLFHFHPRPRLAAHIHSGRIALAPWARLSPRSGSPWSFARQPHGCAGFSISSWFGTAVVPSTSRVKPRRVAETPKHPLAPKAAMTWDAKPVKNAADDSSAGQQSHGPGLADFQIQLLSALMAQTEAINRLAASNEALVQAMAESEGMDDTPPTSYLSGRPIR